MDKGGISDEHADGLIRGGMIARRMIDEGDPFMDHLLARRLQRERQEFVEKCIAIVEEFLKYQDAATPPTVDELRVKLREATL